MLCVIAIGVSNSVAFNVEKHKILNACQFVELPPHLRGVQGVFAQALCMFNDWRQYVAALPLGRIHSDR